MFKYETAGLGKYRMGIKIRSPGDWGLACGAMGGICRHDGRTQRHVTAPSVAGEHASATEEPQQDSGPTCCHLVGRNPVKAKVDGWGRKLWQALVGLT